MNLSAGNWIAVGTGVLAAIVVSVQGYLHRKQMRQAVLHQQDPAKHPLKPPPSKLTLFLRNNLRFIITLINLSLNLGLLVMNMRVTTPLTRRDVLSIALEVASIFFTIVLELGARFIAKVFEMILYLATAQYDAVEKQFKSLDLVSSMQKPMIDLSGRIIDRIGILEEDRLARLKEKAESNSAESDGKLPGEE